MSLGRGPGYMLGPPSPLVLQELTRFRSVVLGEAAPSRVFDRHEFERCARRIKRAARLDRQSRIAEGNRIAEVLRRLAAAVLAELPQARRPHVLGEISLGLHEISNDPTPWVWGADAMERADARLHYARWAISLDGDERYVLAIGHLLRGAAELAECANE